jgi:hypothetical protein
MADKITVSGVDILGPMNAGYARSLGTIHRSTVLVIAIKSGA